MSKEREHPIERAAQRFPRRARPGVGLLFLALSVISPACASRATTTASGTASQVSYVIAANRVAGLRIAPDTSYRRTLHYFARARERGSASFPDDFCRLRFGKIGLSITFFTLGAGAGTPAKCKFFLGAEVTRSRWHTPNGLRVGAPLQSMRRLFPRALNTGKVGGAHWGIPTGSTVWWLTKHASGSHAAQPILVAYVKGGRVVALGITIVGH
jgi:hypothetical protein